MEQIAYRIQTEGKRIALTSTHELQCAQDVMHYGTISKPRLSNTVSLCIDRIMHSISYAGKSLLYYTFFLSVPPTDSASLRIRGTEG